MPVDEQRNTVNLETEMKSAYINYAMSVIVGRALPDVRDGLKPVHRRILYAMFREGLLSNRRYSKSAGVVGEVIKKYHPHGDAAVYDAMVRMAQEFNMRYLLVDGQGNFGSIDGDPPAAYRYTEARLTKLAEEMLADIDMETVDFVPNFDESVVEPTVLPTRIPQLLMNGSSGIAVGMATNIPPHNLGELIDGLIQLLNDPALTVETLMQTIKGPDFPTAGFIYGTKGIQDAYQTGRGSIQLRARAVIEVSEKTEKETIVVTELPYQVNKARLIEKIAELIRDRKIEGISDLRDESDRDGMRIVIELKRGEIASIILNQLYKHTQMQSSFGVIMLSLVNNQPQVLNLKQMLQYFLDFRREVIIRRTRFELREAEARAHILEGLKIALDHLDEVIALIRSSPSPDEAKTGLMRRFGLSELQAQAILDMRLQRLTGLERDKLIAEYREVLQKIEQLKALLASDALIRKAIQDELTEIREKYADDRRTEILPEAGEIHIEDLIAPEEMVITVTHTGYIKRTPSSVYRSQRRGGKGKIGAGLKEEDFVEHLFAASTHDYLLFFTDAGRVYWLKVHQIPEAGRATKGKAIVNLLQIAQTEQITAILSVDQFQEGKFVVMATQKGLIKKTALSAYSNPRAGGIRAINLEEGDRLMAARLTSGNHEILLGTKHGLSIRFHEEEARAVGRVATGVWGIRLEEGDEVISAEVLAPNAQASIMTITEKGYGKRTELSEYRTQGRGGHGIITIQTSPRNGCVIAALQVKDEEEVMLVTTIGKILRLRAGDIRVIGRNTQGVRLIDLEGEERVCGVARLAEKGEREESADAGDDA
ncbi:DNA gyrase subunit A [Candidatus Manganitrophus noduliformans]|uniref:DNA gyrase subunit A n=1 Tax=Candidatus Manganitrophus noduliformans TaxID=2606439 RepID=A0A7X6DM98_9BACT|nr:DNA gyrase subunit A [Candidatus Manganitrophus noduliformans]NKE69513.1 DNA gyrase subunit A [Candidatus Manganitrophus noduliformans]